MSLCAHFHRHEFQFLPTLYGGVFEELESQDGGRTLTIVSLCVHSISHSKHPQRDIRDCEHPTPYERYESANTRATVRKLVKQLPDKECKAVRLLFGFDGLYERTFECIGEELDYSTEGARKACNRGIKKLHDWLSRPEYGLSA